jgi:ribosomal-protein-alanine N-acetyltransferase
MNLHRKETSRLNISPVVSSDKPLIFRGLSHPDVIQYYGVSYDSLEACEEQMHWYRTLVEEGTGCWWAIRLREGNTFIGAGGFNNLDKKHLKAEFGFWLLPQFWGKGYMQEASGVMIDIAFRQWGLHRIEGFVETNNAACKKAIIKLGFEHEGTMRECEQKDGKWISIDIFAKICP